MSICTILVSELEIRGVPYSYNSFELLAYSQLFGYFFLLITLDSLEVDRYFTHPFRYGIVVIGSNIMFYIAFCESIEFWRKDNHVRRLLWFWFLIFFGCFVGSYSANAR